MGNISSYLRRFIQYKNGFFAALGLVIIITSIVLSLQLIVPWRLTDDAENLRMSQEIDKHISSGNFSWILSYEKDSGRFRPFYWVHHYINYKLFGFNSFGQHFSHLILYLLITGLLFILVNKVSKSLLSGIVSVILFLFFYPIAENLYRLGTAEPLLVLLYLLVALILVNIFTTIIIDRGKPKLFDYILLSAITLFAYFTKETSPIIIVAFFPVTVIGLVKSKGMIKRRWIIFSIYFVLINMIFFSLLVGLKNQLGYGLTGSYTRNYDFNLIESIRRFLVYIRMILIDFNFLLVIPLITYFAMIRKNIMKSSLDLRIERIWQLIFLCWFIIFLVVQLPWGNIMGRYLMPSIIWLSIFLGIEIGKYFSKECGFFLKIKGISYSLNFPLISLGAVFFIFIIVYTNSFKLYQMYRFAIRDGRASQRVLKYLAENVPQNGIVYANFSDLIGEYTYEIPLHLRFFYSRPDIKLNVLNLEKENLKTDSFIVSYQRNLDKYKIDNFQKSIVNTEEIIPKEFWYDWRVIKMSGGVK